MIYLGYSGSQGSIKCLKPALDLIGCVNRADISKNVYTVQVLKQQVGIHEAKCTRLPWLNLDMKVKRSSDTFQSKYFLTIYGRQVANLLDCYVSKYDIRKNVYIAQFLMYQVCIYQ